jgi:hypothetical protein
MLIAQSNFKEEMKLRGLLPNFYIHVSVINLCTYHTVGPQTQCSRIGGPIMGIYKSLPDTCMQKLGTRPRSFISGNFLYKFLGQCICSRGYLSENIKLGNMAEGSNIVVNFKRYGC